MPTAEIPRLPVFPTHSGEIGWMLYQPRNVETPPKINQQERLFWTTTALSLDITLEDANNTQTGAFIKRYSPEQTREFQDKRVQLLETITALMQESRMTQYVALTNGTLPDMTSLWNKREVTTQMRNRMNALAVGGTDSNLVISPKIRSILPRIVFRRPMLLHDDVFDTGSAIATVIEYVNSQREDSEYDLSLSIVLANTFGTSYDTTLYRDYYWRVCKQLDKNNILLAISVYKNEPFFRALSAYSHNKQENNPESSWARRQQQLLQSAIHIPQTDWLMGFGMDTDFKGTDIEKTISLSLRTDPFVIPYISHLSEFKLRVGSTVNTLIALQERDDGYSIEEFRRWVYGRINEKLQYIASRH